MRLDHQHNAGAGRLCRERDQLADGTATDDHDAIAGLEAGPLDRDPPGGEVIAD